MATQSEQRQMMLITGFCRTHSRGMHIIPDIITIVFNYQQFDGIWSAEHKGAHIKLCEDDHKAICDGPKMSGHSVRAKDAIHRGCIVSWELTAMTKGTSWNFYGVVSSTETAFDRNPAENQMNSAWGIDDRSFNYYIGRIMNNCDWGKPNIPLRQEFTLKFDANYTESRCKLTIWYNGEKLNPKQDGYSMLLPELDEEHDWYPCATPYNKDAWVRIKYL